MQESDEVPRGSLSYPSGIWSQAHSFANEIWDDFETESKIAFYLGERGRCAMADDEPLKPKDFPIHTNRKKVVRNDRKTIAEARTEKIAEDIAERLNAEEDRREEDRWSA